MLGTCLEKVRINSPVIHNITNYVTVNDCANILLAAGASPIMSAAPEEAQEMAKFCSALNINIGTLNSESVECMLLAGKSANRLCRPVIFDPVGAGATSFRSATAEKLMENIRFAVIKGNASEIKSIIKGKSAMSRGVDVSVLDVICEDNYKVYVSLAKELSEKTGSVIAITGALDIVADKNRAFVIRNGHRAMERITGCGCMLSALCAAFVAANDDPLKATAAAVCAMGLCGQKAYARLSENEGSGTLRTYLIDEIYNLTGDGLERGALIEKA